MSFSINYIKNKNKNLIDSFKQNDIMNLSYIQNYIPIYNKFFNLSENNYNTINLNNKFRLNNITEKLDYSKFNGSVSDNYNNIIMLFVLNLNFEF